MPVTGGPIQTVVPGNNVTGSFLAVDDINVYFQSSDGLYRAPKSGVGSPTLLNEPTMSRIGSATALGGSAFWIEVEGSLPQSILRIKTAPLKGGPTSVVAQFTAARTQSFSDSVVGVTSTTAFLQGGGLQGLASIPIGTGVPDGGGPVDIDAGVSSGFQLLVSDTDAIYWTDLTTLLRVASDGTATFLGSVASGFAGGTVAYDDTYVYWVDALTVGTIMRVPKTGGAPTVLARDTRPLAIAVDAHAVYWNDDAGNILRLAK
jgi:hypothetical protein